MPDRENCPPGTVARALRRGAKRMAMAKAKPPKPNCLAVGPNERPDVVLKQTTISFIHVAWDDEGEES